MKTYKVVLFTKAGFITEIYINTETLQDFEKRMKLKYGLFTTHKATELINHN